MDFDHLTTFLEISKSGSFSRAGQKLYRSQPAVSAQIRQLEQEYGEKLFDDYETRFLKLNVQGELTTRVLNPLNWGTLSSTGWGRSELAAQLYDKTLFNGATFADLYRAGGPMIAVSATELSTGSRIVFIPQNFDVMCADLGTIRLSRAAAASSAVPVVLSPITINNYGGSCGYQQPAWLRDFADLPNPPRPAARALNRMQELQ